AARALDLGAGEPGKARVRLRADGYADGLVRAATRSRRGRVASCPSSTGGERSTLPASHEAGWRAAPGWCGFGALPPPLGVAVASPLPLLHRRGEFDTPRLSRGGVARSAGVVWFWGSATTPRRRRGVASAPPSQEGRVRHSPPLTRRGGAQRRGGVVLGLAATTPPRHCRVLPSSTRRACF